MPITKTPFGTHENQCVHLYTLENASGMRVKLMAYGAAITSISVPDREGGRVELVAGFDKLDGYFSDAYRANAPYFGGTIGRYASRIKDGKFSFDNQDYLLAVNDGSNHLHGGITGFDKRIWTAEAVGEDTVRFSLHSPDGEEGYPGNLDVTVTYRLTEDNALEMTYTGTTDQATPLSLTNHAYFNLSGFTETIHGHTAHIDAQEFLTPDETNIPVGARTPVTETPADLRNTTSLDDALPHFPTGFEHYYVLDHSNGPVAEFSHPVSGRKLTVFTTEPGALFYTGYFTSDELQRENGDRFGRYRAFCFEASRFPNGPNLPEVNDAVLRPGDTYAATTTYQFTF
ncbi:aldose 1-epimerase [Lewinella aquimaris]|uniref:Aldose 1-epimerase n=1 Tax=Neolewinella aquimaris TaxID=1835722 RepID=A0A840EFE8_9BACT|nr:aldose epimerase family protein [Neolewinella aquimaris]MBB4080529.1 aldose 1-epimerase [Neolewinella aquimaris]